MSYTARIQYIISSLIKRGGVTLKEISEEYGISTRQACRDIEQLRDQMGAPIEYSRAEHKYVLTQDWSSYTNLDDNMVILASYFRSLIGQLPLSKAVIEEVEETFLSSITKNAAALMDKVIYRAPSISFPNYSVFSVVTEALTKSLCIRITYTNFSKETSERTVEPLRLVNYEASWYVIAYDHKRQQVRKFHLSRIREARLLDERKTFRESRLDLDDSFGIFTTGRAEEYTIKFSSRLTEDVSHIVWHKEQRIERFEDGSFLLHVPASTPYELITLVLTYAPYARPVAPESFVEEYRKRVEEINATLSDDAF
ncbi:MAG: helix-turn-helix transcriptional regulator [Bullifex sp.]